MDARIGLNASRKRTSFNSWEKGLWELIKGQINLDKESHAIKKRDAKKYRLT